MDKKRTLGQYMTPEKIAIQMCLQIKRKVKDWRIFDPSCGDGNLLISAAKIMLENNVPNIEERLFGIDIDRNMVNKTKGRLSNLLGCDSKSLNIIHGDFFELSTNTLFSDYQFDPESYNTVISNPPYGNLREYRFFDKCVEVSLNGTELIFLLPLAFIDRVKGVEFIVLDGKPMNVTPGHAIIHHESGKTYNIEPVIGMQKNSTALEVFSGAKLYELGAGDPPQTKNIVTSKPYSSDEFIKGWIPCLRTGDVHSYKITFGRLWVDYGQNLAHPKTIDRFQGPRIIVRRMPIWKTRQLGAAYIEKKAIAAGDLLIVKHKDDDMRILKGVCVFLNSTEAADLILNNRPSVKFRTSYPKISAKDLNWLFEYHLPRIEDLLVKASQYVIEEKNAFNL